MLAHPLLRRLLSPAGLLLVALCFLLPFVAVSCDSPQLTVTAEYSGADLLVGGTPSVHVTGEQVPRESAEDEAEEPIDVQPAAVLAMLAILAGIGAAALPRHRQRLFGGATAAGATVLLLVVNQILVHGYLGREVERELGPNVLGERGGGDFVATRYGFWLALAVAVVVAAGHCAALYRHARPGPAEPVAGGPVTGGSVPGEPPPVPPGTTIPPG